MPSRWLFLSLVSRDKARSRMYVFWHCFFDVTAHFRPTKVSSVLGGTDSRELNGHNPGDARFGAEDGGRAIGQRGTHRQRDRVDGHELAVGLSGLRPRRRHDAITHSDQVLVILRGARDIPAAMAKTAAQARD